MTNYDKATTTVVSGIRYAGTTLPAHRPTQTAPGGPIQTAEPLTRTNTRYRLVPANSPARAAATGNPACAYWPGAGGHAVSRR